MIRKDNEMKKLNKKMKITLSRVGISLIVAGTGLTYTVGNMVYKETVGYVHENTKILL